VKRYFRQIIDVHPEEFPQFTMLSIIYFIFIVGLVWSENAIRAEVVKADLLATAQLVSSIFVVVSSVVYTAYVDRIPKNHMVMILLFLGLIGIATVTTGIIIMQGSFDILGYFSLFVVHRFFFFIWVIHWFTYIIDLYDTQAAKRIFPLLSTARPFATMFAGFSFSPLTKILGVSHNMLMVIWVAIIMAVMALFGLMPLILKKQGGTDSLARRNTNIIVADTSGLKSLEEGFRYVMASSFLRWMAVSALVLIAINTIVEFEVAELIKGFDFIESTEDFSSFTAMIDGVTNIFVLIFQFTLFNVILRRIGLGNMNLIYPLLVFGVSISILIAPTMLPEMMLLIAAFGYANYRGIRRVIRDPVFALLNNAVPVHAKGRARSVINAILSPMGGVFAAALLTVITQLPSWVVPLVLMSGCVIYLISAFVLRLEYTRAMVQMLQQQSFTFLLSQRNEIGVTDSATMHILAENIKNSVDPEFNAFMASIIAEIGGRDSLPILIDMVNQADGDYKGDLVEVIYHADFRTDNMRLIYENLLHDDDSRIREYAIRGLGRVIGANSLDYMMLIQPLLGDEELDVKAITIIAMIKAGQDPYKSQAEQYLALLLQDDNPIYRVAGVEILGSLDNAEHIGDLVPHLDDISDEVRLQATQSLLNLWSDNVPPNIYQMILERIDSFMDDHVERIRLVELSLLAQIDEADSINVLIRALNDSSVRVRDVAVESLIKKGQSVEKQLLQVAQAGDSLQNKMATIALSKINNDEYGHLLNTYIDMNLDGIYLNYKRLYALETCHSYSSVTILENAVSGELESQIDDTFKLIAYGYAAESLDLIKESLQSSDGRTRSNAVEALESVTNPQLARRMSPMLNPDMTTEVLANMNEESQLDTFQVLLDITRSGNDWLRAVTLYAFGEIGRNHPDLHKILSNVPSQADSTVEMDACQRILKMDAVSVALRFSSQKDSPIVRLAAKGALRYLRGESVIMYAKESLEESVLSIVERMIFLKKVSFFQGVAVDQLKVLASICEEELFSTDDIIFREGERGDSLHVVVNGAVGIGIFSKSSDNFTELAVYRANSAFGEMTLFDHSPRSASAVAKSDVLLLKLRSEPLLALMYQDPDLSIELLRSMSNNLRNANSRIASLSSTMRKSF
jgi:HEAT repeat protein